jgi:drug/metabolite transporter (DMT)-like permease
MSYIALAIVSYFLVGLEIILDKFLLSSKKISHPAIYTFYSGILSLFALLIFSPFGFHKIGFGEMILSLSAGLIFTYGILNLFFAINKSEASQVTPVVGAMVPLITYLLSIFFLQERLTQIQLAGVLALIAGGLLISFDFPLKINKNKFFAGFYNSLAAGFFLAIAFTSFKHFYEQDNFTNVFVWTRIGLFLGALTLLAVPAWRKVIFNSLKGFRKPKKEGVHTGFLFVFNKGLGGVGSVMTNYAISLGSVTIVNALVSTEYLFILMLGIIFSVWFPNVFRERRDLKSIFGKIIAITLITVGVVLISFHFHK